MDATAMTTLITGTLTTYGGALVTVLGAVIGIGVAYLVFRFGWKKVKGSTH
jgi:high-affinity Fe2+/Pb2+ permease